MAKTVIVGKAVVELGVSNKGEIDKALKQVRNDSAKAASDAKKAFKSIETSIGKMKTKAAKPVKVTLKTTLAKKNIEELIQMQKRLSARIQTRSELGFRATKAKATLREVTNRIEFLRKSSEKESRLNFWKSFSAMRMVSLIRTDLSLLRSNTTEKTVPLSGRRTA